jgi:Tol biopolymer transport system component
MARIKDSSPPTLRRSRTLIVVVPGGDMLVFHSNKNHPAAAIGFDLWTMKAERHRANTHHQHEQHRAERSLVNAAYPDWSPRGDRIAFTGHFNQNRGKREAFT